MCHVQQTAAVLVETMLDAHSAEAEYPSLLNLYRKVGGGAPDFGVYY